MKCTIPEISWHNKDPVLSVDIQPLQNDCYKLASGGTDCHVLVWNLKIRDNGSVDLRVVSDLSRHQRSVNVVRWSPTGTYLASGDDDANIIIWHLRTDQVPLFEEESHDEECWIVFKILRGHKEDVYDISWSPNEAKLISGSIDNTAILWDFNKGQTENILSDHKGFVQGVNWDPKGEFIATISSDRTCRIFDSTGRHVKARIQKGQLPVPESHALHEKEIKYFHDDTFKSYFRRLSFSPDGNLLIVPSGCVDIENYSEFKTATYIFSISELAQPVAIIPSSKQETIAVRCCPILFELHSDGPISIIDLPYRMVIAVATDSDVILYDTQQVSPFAHFQKVHYTRITDLTWSPDGLLLIASSTDGFCTLITFEPDELGVQHIKEDSEPEDNPLNISGCEELSESTKNEEKDEVEVKKPTILEKWTVRTPKRDVNEISSKHPPPKPSQNDKEKINRLIPKRIVPVKIGNCSKKKDINASAEKVTDNIVVIDDDSNDMTPNLSPNNDAKNGNSPTEDTSKQNTESKKTNVNPKNSILKFFLVASSKTSTIKTDQIEENTAECIELSDTDSNKSAPSIPKEKMEVDNHETAEKENLKKKLDNLDISKNAEAVEVSEASTKETSEKENMKNKLDSPDRSKSSNSISNVEVKAVKTPRRIPFVTLDSPKRKKKE